MSMEYEPRYIPIDSQCCCFVFIDCLIETLHVFANRSRIVLWHRIAIDVSVKETGNSSKEHRVT